MTKRNYIKNTDGDFWSNDMGWVDFKGDATAFTDEETQTLDLPLDGHWENDAGREDELERLADAVIIDEKAKIDSGCAS